MIYIKELKPLPDNYFDFYLSNGEILKYRKTVSSSTDKYYLNNLKGINNSLFNRLGFIDDEKDKFVSKIVGYECRGDWPEVKSEKDLIRVIHALCAYNNPKSSKVDSIIEDYPILSFYNTDKTVVTFKELNVNYYLQSGNSYWWTTSDVRNENYIFTQLKITDKNKWVKNIQGYYITEDEDYFPASETKEDAYKVMDSLIEEYIRQQFKPKTTIKTNSYGDSKIELRRKKADVRVGNRTTGSVIYGKRSKASIRSGRVSYQTCIGS